MQDLTAIIDMHTVSCLKKRRPDLISELYRRIASVTYNFSNEQLRATETTVLAPLFVFNEHFNPEPKQVRKAVGSLSSSNLSTSENTDLFKKQLFFKPDEFHNHKILVRLMSSFAGKVQDADS